MKMTKGTRRWIAVLGAVATATAITVTPAAAQDTLEKIKSSGKLVAGVRFDFPPMGTIDANGNPVGFGADLAKEFADKLGVSVEYVQTTSKTRIPLLVNGSIDADIGPTTPTVKREQVVDFTIPYVWDAGTIVVRKGSSPDLKDYAPPKTIATTQGSLFVDLVEAELPNAEFLLLQEYPDTIVALLNGKADAVATNRFNAVAVLERQPDLMVGNDYFADPWAIGVRQNDSPWRDFLNITMQEMWQSGKFQELYANWFGAEPNWMMWSQFRLQPGVGN